MTPWQSSPTFRRSLAEPLYEPLEMDSLNALRLLSDTVKQELGDHVSVCNCMCAHECVCTLPFSYCARSGSSNNAHPVEKLFKCDVDIQVGVRGVRWTRNQPRMPAC